MAQHDYVISNGTGAAVRSDLNNALAAIVSNNSGSTEPATMYAYQYWADTTTGLLKQRNAANNAWITIRQLDGEWSTIPVENGSASAPSIYFKDSGTDTGFYSPGTDQVAISTGGTGRLFITSGGLVGVGTISPSSLVHLSVATAASDGTKGVRITNPAGTAAMFECGSSNDSYIGTTSGSDFSIRTNNTSRIYVTNGGNVGVGTQSPAANLHIASTAGAGLRIQAGSSNDAQIDLIPGGQSNPYYIYVNSSRNLIFQDFNSERARIDSSGRLLVGTSSARSNLFNGSEGGIFQVEGTSGTIQSLIGNANATGGNPSFVFGKSRGTSVGSTTVLQSGDLIGRLSFQGADGTEFVQAADIYAEVDGTPGANDMPGRIVLSTTADGASSPTERMRINNSGQVILSQGAPKAAVTSYSGEGAYIHHYEASSGLASASERTLDISSAGDGTKGGNIRFFTNTNGTAGTTERMRINANGSIWLNGTNANPYSANEAGISTGPTSDAYLEISRASNPGLAVNRKTNDGTLVNFGQDATTEGSISVSGTTISYNGAHLSRWTQLPGGVERTEILRGTVLSNIDEMCEWGEEDNEQLNRMKVSDVEGDRNVSGVFQDWDDDDDTYTNDFYCAMTGDFIIRIAEGVTVERGDLLMSAGDGTAKPQDDDIIRSKTIAKVTSNHVTCTYEDGSYCVPCVLMAC